MTKFYRLIKSAFLHAGSGSNMDVYRLFKQAMPYFFLEDGTSLPPITVFLSVNSVCNLRCKTCDVGQQNRESTFFKNLNPGSRSELDYERIIELISEIREHRPHLAITTTEPLLYRRIADVVEAASKSSLQTSITTNGYLLEGRAHELLDANLDVIYVSLDGPSDVHDDIRGKRGAFDKAICGIQRLASARDARRLKTPQIRVACTISNFNYHVLMKLAKVLSTQPIDCVYVSQYNYVNQDTADRHNRLYASVGLASSTSLAGGACPAKVDVDCLYEQIVNIKKQYGSMFRFSPDFNRSELFKFYAGADEVVWNSRCLVPWFAAEVIANGDVIPMTRCFDVKFGNIYNSTLSEIWNGEKMKAFRRSLRQQKLFPVCTRCRGCL